MGRARMMLGAVFVVLSWSFPARADNYSLVHVACGHHAPACPTCWSQHLIVFTVGKSDGATVDCSYGYKWRAPERASPPESEWEVRACDKRLPAMSASSHVITWRAPAEPPHKCMPNDVVQLDRISGRFRVCVSAPNLDCSDGAMPE
jgi:hypothetical protein